MVRQDSIIEILKKKFKFFCFCLKNYALVLEETKKIEDSLCENLQNKNELTEREKIYIEHLYKNQTGLINEIRVVDKTAIFLTGVVWAWLLSSSSDVHKILFILPSIMTIFVMFKAFKLMSEFREQRKQYFNVLLKVENKVEKNECAILNVGGFNKIFYYSLVVFNFIAGVYFLFV